MKKEVKLNISPLHAETVAVHLLIVLKNFIQRLNRRTPAESTDNPIISQTVF